MRQDLRKVRYQLCSCRSATERGSGCETVHLMELCAVATRGLLEATGTVSDLYGKGVIKGAASASILSGQVVYCPLSGKETVKASQGDLENIHPAPHQCPAAHGDLHSSNSQLPAPSKHPFPPPENHSQQRILILFLPSLKRKKISLLAHFPSG